MEEALEAEGPGELKVVRSEEPYSQFLINLPIAHTTWAPWAAPLGCSLGLTFGYALQLAVSTIPDGLGSPGILE